MPCQSDYLQHSEREAESGRVIEFLKEMSGEPYDHDNPSYYGNVRSLDTDTARLCGLLKDLDQQTISNLSLELQLWWKRHQKVDREREESGKGRNR